MKKSKGTFNQGWWNCFETFANYNDEKILKSVLSGAGITIREADAWLSKPGPRNPKAEQAVIEYRLQLY